MADLASGPEELGSGAAASPPSRQFVELDHNVALGMFSRVDNLQAATQKAVRDIIQSLWSLLYNCSVALGRARLICAPSHSERGAQRVSSHHTFRPAIASGYT